MGECIIVKRSGSMLGNGVLVALLEVLRDIRAVCGCVVSRGGCGTWGLVWNYGGLRRQGV